MIRRSQRALTWVMSIAVAQLAVPWEAFAQQAPTSLDLSSTEATVTVDASHTQSANVKVGDTTVSVGAGSVVTPATYAAFLQAISNSGDHSLVLGAGGNAIGGTLQLTPQLSRNLVNVVVPTNVSLVHDFGTGSALNLAGNLTNSGNFYAISTNTNVTNAVINAGSIFNNHNALLTSVLPQGGLAGITGALSNLSLTLNVVNDVINAGAITSAANLNITAGGSIVNSLPSGVTGINSVIQAVQNLNLTSQLGNIVNSGTMSAMTGNVNIASINNLVINSMGGRIEALAGNINIRDLLFDAKQDLNLTGGDWLSTQLNAFSGRGAISIDADHLSGILNTNSHALKVVLHDGSLKTGTITATGDPYFATQNGDHLLFGPINTGGGPLAIVATGNVVSAAPGVTINTDNAAGNGGDVLISAGFRFSDNGTTATILGDGECCGGSVLFDGTGGNVPSFTLASISAKGSGAGTNGGHVRIITRGGPLNAGTVNMSGTTIDVSGGAGAAPGNVTIIADAGPRDVNSPVSINTGNILALGAAKAPVGTQTFGNVTIATAAAALNTLSAACNPCIQVDSNAVTGGAILGQFTIGPSTVREMSLITQGIQTNGGSVALTAGRGLFVGGNISTGSNTAGVTSGSVTVNVNTSVPLEIAAAGSTNRIAGTVVTSTLLAGADSGAITINNSGSGGITLIDPSRVTSFFAGLSKGGAISLNAGSGTLAIDNSVNLQLRSAGGLGGGAITLTGQTLSALGTIRVFLNARINGGPTGAGGAITLNQSGTTPIGIGINAGEFTLLSQGPDGGSVNVSAPALMTVDGVGIIVNNTAATGKGGSITLSTAGSNPLADLRVTSLFANGGGDGGRITLTSGSVNTFIINGAGASVNGVNGVLAARGGNNGQPGAGGTITVNSASGISVTGAGTLQAQSTNNGAGGKISLNVSGPGGITLSAPDVFTVSAGNTSGGSITLSAPNGAVDTGTGTFNLSGVGVGPRNGGTFTLTAQSLPNNNFNVLADGSDTGAGGTISITTTGKNFVLVRGGGGVGVSDTFARGGISAGGGNGGSITLSSALDISLIDPSTGDVNETLSAQPRGGNGNGGIYSFTAGRNLKLSSSSGTFLANGVGTGDGGSVTLVSNSALNFVNGGGLGILNGFSNAGGANINAAAGSVGKGGTISITNTGTGGLGVIDAFRYSVAATKGAGGTFNFEAPNGSIPLILGKSFDVSGAGAGNNAGGSFTLNAQDIVFTGGGFSVDVLANGINNAAGGSISITEKDPNNVLATGLTGSSFVLSANGGTAGGKGGTLILSSGIDLVVDASFASARPLGGDGGGGTYTYTSGTLRPADLFVTNGTLDAAAFALGNGAGGTVTLSSDRVVSVQGDIAANGAGTGAGGKVTVTTNGINDPFIIGTPAVSGVFGAILANGTQGGEVTINSVSGIELLSGNGLNSINVAASAGVGGKLTLNAGSRDLSINLGPTNALNLNAVNVAGVGGSFIVEAGRVVYVGGTTMNVSANGFGAGNGGTVSIKTKDAAFDLTAGPTGLFAITARSGAGEGNGGNITLESGRALTINMAGVLVNPLFNGNGANYTFRSGTFTTAADLTVTGTIDANAVAGANPKSGGNVTLESTRDLSVSGAITTNGAGLAGGAVSATSKSPTVMNIGGAGTNAIVGGISTNGAGAGAITLANSGVGGIQLTPASISQISTAAGGNLTATATNSAIFISGGTLNQSAGGSKGGGSLTLTAQAIIPSGHVSILTNGGPGGGNAGNVTLNATGSASFLEIGTVAAGLNQFDIRANGLGAGGTGGTISLTAAARIEITGTNTGNAATYSLQAFPGSLATGGTINVTATGTGGGCCGSVLFLDPVTYSGATGAVRLNISTNSPNAFIIGLPGAGNGVTGNINMDGGVGFNSAGGTLTITNSGSGGVQMTAGAQITARGGSGSLSPGGGNVTINAASGTWLMSEALIDVSATDSCGAGGTITLNLNSVANAATATGAMTLLANGGLIGGPSGLIGRGGTITINYASTISDLVFGSTVGQFNASATGGIKGGTAVLSAGRNISIDPANFSIAQTNLLGGDAGSFSATAQNVFVNGNLNLNGSGIGDGGTVKITTSSGSAFFVSPSLFGLNGIRGTLTVNAGASGGNGGTIELNLGNSLLQLTQGTTISASATGTAGANSGAFNGGTIKINSLFVLPSGAGPITFTADAAGNGNGGLIELNQAANLLQIGSATGQFSFSARGGSVGSQFGNGGTLAVRTPNQLTVTNTANFTASPIGTSGNGGNLLLESVSGPISVNGGLSVNGSGVGNGGSIILRQTGVASNALTLGVVAANAIQGPLTAFGGFSGGHGGEIRIETKGTVIFNGGYSISASGTGNTGNGGTIVVEAGTFGFVGPATVIGLAALGGGNSGDGGNVTLKALFGPVAIGPGANQFAINVPGGSVGSYGGNGGVVSISGTTLVVDPLSIFADPLGFQGNGANLSFTATNQAQFIAPITVNAASQAGNGGSISIVVNNANPFTISGTPSINGVQGNLRANAGSLTGKGGSISVQNDATAGGITIANGVTIAVNPGAVGEGGSLKFTAKAPFTSGISLNASGGLVSRGGTIELEGTTITGPAAGPLGLTAAGGLGGGDGGTVKVKSTSVALNGNLTVGNAINQIAINVRPGPTLFGTANAGVVDVSAGNSLTVDPAGLLATPFLVGNGNAGTVRLGANTAFAGNLFITGNLNLDGAGVGDGGVIDIKVRGQNVFTVNPGFGGPSGVNGLLSANAGSIAGIGGSMLIEARSPNNVGGVAFGAGQTIFVNSSGLNSNGGTIKVNAFTTSSPLPIQFLGAGSTFAADASGGSGKGGEIDLTGARFVFGTGNVLVQANGGPNGHGGKVTLRADGISGLGSDLIIGAGAGQFAVSATGGSISGIAGNGGEVTFAVGSISNNLTVNPASLTFGTSGSIGNGGKITAVSANNLFINGNLLLDGGASAGNGGTVDLTSAGLQSASFFTLGAGATTNGVNGVVSANGGTAGGDGGTINITNTNQNGFGIRFLGLGQSIFANAGSRGNGGNFNLNAGPGNVDLNNLSVVGTQASDNGTGGHLQLTGRQIVFNAANNPLLLMQGQRSGDGGRITLTTTQSGVGNINIGLGAGNLRVDVRSLGTGNGGTLTANAAANLAINANGMDLILNNDRGAVLVGTSGTSVSAGTLTTTGVINTGNSSKSSLTLTTNFVSNFIAQNAGGQYVGRTINLTSNQTMGALATPIMIRASADPNALNLATSAGASAFVRQLIDPATLGTVTVGNQFSMVSENNLANTGVVAAQNNVTLSTLFGTRLTVSNNITGGAGGTVNLSTAGADIRQFNGVISGQSVNLTVPGVNDIGSSLARVTTSTTLLSVSTGGSAFIFNLKPLQVQTALVTNTLNVLSCGNILFTNPVTANTLLLGAFNADITAFGSQLANVANLGVTFANNATFTGLTNPANILRSTVANTYTLQTSQTINITNEIRGNRIILTSGLNQGISIGANLTGTGTNSLVFLTTGGAGNITRTAGVISGTTAQLQSSTGSFGQSIFFPIRILSSNIQLNSSGNSSAFIQRPAAGSQTLLPGNIGTGGFDWVVADTTTPNTFSTFSSQGSFSIQSASALIQSSGVVSTANNGGITLDVLGPGRNLTLNGSLQSSGTGTLFVRGAGAVSVGNLTGQSGNVTVMVTSLGSSVTLVDNATIQTNTGNITLQTNNNGTGNISLNGIVRTNLTGDITISSTRSLTTRGLSTGSALLAPGNGNDINVTVGIGQSMTLQTNSSITAGFGNISIASNGAGGTITLDGQLNTLTGGAVTLNANGNISTASIQTGSQISLAGIPNNNITMTSTTGSIVTQPFGNLFAGNNGSISLTANGALGQINVQAGQVMTQQNGSINITAGGAINFGAVTTNIGDLTMQASGAITQIAGLESHSVTGNVLISSTNASIALNGSVSTLNSGTLTVTANQNLTVNRATTGSIGAVGANNIVLTATNGTFTLLGNGGFISSGQNGNITLNQNGPGQSLILNASSNIQAGPGTSNISILSSSPITMNGQVLANNGFIDVQSGTGSITVGASGVVQATNAGAPGLQLRALAAIGDVIVNGAVRTQIAGAVSIQAGNGVTLNSATLASGNLSIQSGTGPITTGLLGNITVQNGSVTMTSSNSSITLNAQLNKVSGGGDINLTSLNGLSVGGVLTNQGNINLTTSSGMLLLRSGSGPIQTQNGNVTVLQNGTGALDRILTQPNVIVNALSPSPGIGNIVFSVGNAAPPQAVGNNPNPATIFVNNQSGGQVFFNAPVNGLAIAANGPQNTLTTKNATITFFINAASAFGAGAITLGGANNFLADPPGVAGPVGAVQAAQSAVSPTGLPVPLMPLLPASHSFGAGNWSVPGAGGYDSGTMPGAGAPGNGRMSDAGASGSGTIPGAGAPSNGRISGAGASGSGTMPGAGTFGSGASAGEKHDSPLVGGIEMTGRARRNGSAYVRAHSTAVLRIFNNDQYDLERGEIVVTASRSTTVTTGRHAVRVGSGAIVHVGRQGSITTVRNLADDMRSAVRLMIDGRAIKVGIGEEVVVGDDQRAVDVAMSGEHIGHRNVRSFKIDDAHLVVHSEVSLINLIGKNHLLSSMYKGSSVDRQVIERVMKMAACLFQVTSRRGAYKAYEAGTTMPTNVTAAGTATAVKVAQANN